MLEAQQRILPRPLLITVYTQNCGYCQMQEKILEKDSIVRNLITKYYHFSTLDAYTQDTLIINGRTYTPNPHNHFIHPLVAELAGDTEIAYPFWVIISPDRRIVFRHKGVLSATTLRRILDLYSKF